MAQDPNLPRLKIGEGCRNQLEPLVQALHELITAAHPGGGMWLISHPRMLQAIAKAKKNLNEAELKEIIGDKAVSQIYSLLGDIPPKFPESQAEIDALANVYNNLDTAINRTVDALLDAAVDCECREAKAAYEQLGSEALQTVLEGKGEGDGRPRRYTEIAGEE